MLLYVGNGDHGDHLARLFGSHRGFYNRQWPLTGHYFKHCLLCKANVWKYSNFEETWKKQVKQTKIQSEKVPYFGCGTICIVQG